MNKEPFITDPQRTPLLTNYRMTPLKMQLSLSTSPKIANAETPEKATHIIRRALNPQGGHF